MKLLLFMTAATLATLGFLFSAALPLIVSQFLKDGPLLLAWIGACWGIGTLLAKPLRIFEEADEAVVLGHLTRIGVGMGLLSALVLILGSAGIFNQPVAIALLIAANVLTLRAAYSNQTLISTWLRGPIPGTWPILFTAPVVAMTLVGALIIPWILWGDEPHGYDVVAYHLQLPREWFEQGRIGATPHNVFGYFPLNVEMHYLFAMTVKGGAYAGMYLAQLMHATMAILTFACVYAGVRTISTDRPRFGAAAAVVLCASFPWLLMLGSVAYNECGVMLFTTLAITWALRKRWLLAGLCAGFAAGCKITSVPTLVALLPAIVLLEAVTRKRFEWRGVTLLLLGSLISLSPWLTRTTILTGNPVFPIAMRSLGSGHFDGGMVERFEVAHAARPDQQSINQRLFALNEQVGREFKFGSIVIGSVGVPILLLLAVPAFAMRSRDRSAWIMMAFILGNIGIWVFATHLQGRFLVPIIPIVALLVGGAAWRGGSIVIIVVAISSAVLTFGTVLTRLMNAPTQSAIGYESPSIFLPEELTRRIQSTNRPVYLVGESKAFLYPVSQGRLHYRSVFDVSSTERFKEAWLGKSPASDGMVIVLPSELERFEKTYRNLPPMPDAWRGRPAFITDVEFKTFEPLQ